MIGCSPGKQIEAGLRHAGPEPLHVGEQPLAQIIALLGQIDRLERRADDRRRQGVGEEIGPRALPHQIDDRLRARR